MQPHTASDICAVTAPASPIHALQRAIAAHFKISMAAMLSVNRAYHIARPRQIAMWIVRHTTTRSLPEIGRLFNRHHTTVMHALDVVDQRMADDPALAAEVRTLGLRCAPRRWTRP